MRWLWRNFNPLVMRLARWSDLWAVLETAGRRSGRPRRIPLAAARVGRAVWIVAAQGERAAYVKNLSANSRVRISIRDRWYTGQATLLGVGASLPRGVGWYVRAAAHLWPDEHRVVRIDLD